MSNPKDMTEDELAKLERDCVVMARDDTGPSVLLTPDRRVIRIFRRGSPLSPRRAQRFARNARRLNDFGIPAPPIEAVKSHPESGLDLVIYPWIPGTEIRRLSPGTPQFTTAFEQLAGLIALLHYKAITASKIDLGNIILTQSGGLVLTHVGEVHWHWLPMNPINRARALRPVFVAAEDRSLLRSFGIKRFLGIYLLVSGMSRFGSALFLRRLAGSI